MEHPKDAIDQAVDALLSEEDDFLFTQGIMLYQKPAAKIKYAKAKKRTTNGKKKKR